MSEIPLQNSDLGWDSGSDHQTKIFEISIYCPVFNKIFYKIVLEKSN